MAISKEDILEAVGSMTVMELNDLVKAFEEKFGVSAASLAVAAPGAGGGAAEGPNPLAVDQIDLLPVRLVQLPLPGPSGIGGHGQGAEVVITGDILL